MIENLRSVDIAYLNESASNLAKLPLPRSIISRLREISSTYEKKIMQGNATEEDIENLKSFRKEIFFNIQKIKLHFLAKFGLRNAFNHCYKYNLSRREPDPFYEVFPRIKAQAKLPPLWTNYNLILMVKEQSLSVKPSLKDIDLEETMKAVQKIVEYVNSFKEGTKISIDDFRDAMGTAKAISSLYKILKTQKMNVVESLKAEKVKVSQNTNRFLVEAGVLFNRIIYDLDQLSPTDVTELLKSGEAYKNKTFFMLLEIARFEKATKMYLAAITEAAQLSLTIKNPAVLKAVIDGLWQALSNLAGDAKEKAGALVAVPLILVALPLGLLELATTQQSSLFNRIVNFALDLF